MNKSTKGAFAAGTAAVLLLGGAGSLAYWTADGTVAGGTINSGELKLVPVNCGNWTLDIAGGTATSNVAISSYRVVPGDVLTKTCTYTIKASGDHLSANLAVSTPTVGTGAAPVSELSATGSYMVGITPTQATITSADDTKVLSATMTVKFPGGAATNASQGLQAAALTNYVVTATQTHAS